MLNNSQLAELDALGFGTDIDALESYVEELQDAAADGEPLVEDSVYDQYRRLLEQVKPDSAILSRNWEKDSDEPIDNTLDEFLISKGMTSIKTCTNDSEISIRQEQHKALNKDEIEYLISTKLNGHAFRAVYKYGELVSGTTRGRNTKGRSLLRHLKVILPNTIEEWKYTPLTEVRGELLVKQSIFDSQLKHIRKSPLAAVTSLSKDSATDVEIGLLSAVCYKIFQSEMAFDTLSDEMEHLDRVGFETPYRVKQVIKVSELISSLNDIVDDFGQKYQSGQLCDYNCDGLVCAINDNIDFYKLGKDKNAWQGNLALKYGVWECSHYQSTIESIEWVQGKQWLIPKARIKPITTTSGQTVYVVPLYNVGILRKLNLTVGSSIDFRFGGETGVMLLTPDGKSVSSLKD